MNILSKNKTLLKVMSILIVQAFLLSSLSWAASDNMLRVPAYSQRIAAGKAVAPVVTAIITLKTLKASGFDGYLNERYKAGELNAEQVASIKKEVLNWLTNKNYPPKLVRKLKELIKEKNWKLITECFVGEIAFGTAGIRGLQVDPRDGVVLPGINVINDWTVARYALGLARMMLKTKQEKRGVVIGGDTRIKSVLPYNNKYGDEISYSKLEAKILRKMGVKIYRFKEPRSIAEAALATVMFDAASMAYNSASHNLWHDNGVKASNEFSAQLFANEREAILAEIKAVTPEDIAALDLDDFDLNKDRKANPEMHIVLGGIEDQKTDKTIIDFDSKFIKVNQSYVSKQSIIKKYSSKVCSVYTPIHGVGIYTIPQILNDGKNFNFNVKIYEAQRNQDKNCRFKTTEKPDPNFINLDTGVRTLDAAIAEAERVEREEDVAVDFVFGTDPDSDRSSYAVKDRNGNWVVLKANDVWALFAWYRLSQSKKLQGRSVIKTWVTTDLIRDIAEDPNFSLQVFEPAVGFNKIAEVAIREIALPIFAKQENIDVEKLHAIKHLSLDELAEVIEKETGKQYTRKQVIDRINNILKDYLLFGCEESNGISPGGHTLEKDGTVAAVIFHEIAAYVKYVNDNKAKVSKKDKYLGRYFNEFNNNDLTIYELLNRVYLEYGYYATENIPLMFAGLTGNAQKNKVLNYITELAEKVNKKNITLGVADRIVKKAISGIDATQSKHISFNEKGYKFILNPKKGKHEKDWLAFRPSGTEPYIRCYGQLKKESDELTWTNIETEKKETDKKITALVLEAQRVLQKEDKKQFLQILKNIIGSEDNVVIVTDKDETLTPAQVQCEPFMLEKITAILQSGTKFAVISGASRNRMKTQLIDVLKEYLNNENIDKTILENLILLPCSGSEILRYDLSENEFTEVEKLNMREKIGEEKFNKVLEILEETMRKFGLVSKNPEKARQISDKQSQITFRGQGKLSAEEAKTFDRDRTKRKPWRDYIDQRLQEEEIEVEARIAGTTSIDILPKGINKEYGIRRLKEIFKISSAEIVFTGDSFEEIGNDYTAIDEAAAVINVGTFVKHKRIINSSIKGPVGLGDYFDMLIEEINKAKAAASSKKSNDGVTISVTNGKDLTNSKSLKTSL